MKLSIIIPFYNSEKHLKECLNSVCKQIKKNVEIILINDASTDKSTKISKKFVKKYSFLRIININKNRGVSYCRNIGIKKSTGEYIGFLDSDDQYLKGGINIILHNIKKYNNKDLFVLSGKENNENVIRFDQIDDIYFDQLNIISNDLLNKSNGQNIDNMLLNMKIIDQWLN